MVNPNFHSNIFHLDDLAGYLVIDHLAFSKTQRSAPVSEWTKDQKRLFMFMCVRKMEEIVHDVVLEMTERKVDKAVGDLPDCFERTHELMDHAKRFGLINYKDDTGEAIDE